MLRATSVLLLLAFYSLAQAPAFEVASVKPSKLTIGHDGTVTTGPARFIAKNATLQRLIFEAYQLPYAQIIGGPAWLNASEYDIDAKSPTPTTPEQLRLMLRTLLADRFHLALHTGQKQRIVFTLIVAKGGPTLHAIPTDRWQFHGDMANLANLLAIQLTIPLSADPTTPTRATGTPVPVLDKTGIAGTYDLSLDLKPDPTTDTVTIWQRALGEQLGLKLNSAKAPVEVLVVDHADKLPTPD